MAVESVTLTDSGASGVFHPANTFFAAPQEPVAVKLGRLAPDPTKRFLKFGDYRNERLSIALPDKVDYASKASDSIQRMYLNDQYGDCVIAGKYHAVGVWTGNDSASTVLGTDQEVYASYQGICGRGDNGCVITRVLDTFRDSGLPFNGVRHKIDGYVGVDWTNKDEVKAAIYLFGAMTIGVNLPSAWTNSAVWDVTNTRIVGGHDVTCVGYDSAGVQISSWGRVYTITWAAFTSRTWLEEAFAMLAPDWYGDDKLAPCGVDAEALKRDLAIIGGGDVPPIDPPKPPTPPVPPAELHYVGTMQGTIPGWFGSSFGSKSFTGTVELKPVLVPKNALGVEWLSLLQDILGLVSAVKDRNISAIVTAAEKILVDLGLMVPREHLHAMATSLASMKVNWFSLGADVLALLMAVASRNLSAILAALQKVLHDLGLSITL